MEFDAEFQKIKEYLDTPKIGVVNVDRRREMMEAYELIKKIILTKDPDATVEIINDPLQMGAMAIRAVTFDVTVYDTAVFAEATAKADNFQIYPTDDDRVKLDVLFESVIEYTLTDD